MWLIRCSSISKDFPHVSHEKYLQIVLCVKTFSKEYNIEYAHACITGGKDLQTYFVFYLWRMWKHHRHKWEPYFGWWNRLLEAWKQACLKQGPFFNQSEVRSFDQWEACIQIKSNHVPRSSETVMVRFQIAFSPKYLSTMIAEQERFFGSLVCYGV